MKSKSLNILENLKSDDTKIRHEAAINFIDFILEGKEILLNQISKLENKNYTGTLVYALMHLNCSDNFDIILDLILNGSYEDYMSSIEVYLHTIFKLSNDKISNFKTNINNYLKTIDDKSFEKEEKDIRIKAAKDIYRYLESCEDN
jgi:hypothetical protein